MTQNQEIRNWNLERNIPQRFNPQAEAAMLLEEVTELLQASNRHAQIDALCDVVVLAVGAMYKLGFDADIAMKETIEEISDRTGFYDVDVGKWLKGESRDDRYIADYFKAEMLYD